MLRLGKHVTPSSAVAGCSCTTRHSSTMPVQNEELNVVDIGDSELSHTGLRDLVGSQWRLEYNNPSFGQREYHVILRKEGKLVSAHPNEKTPDDDRWEIRSKKIVLIFNKGYAIYTGQLSDNNHMVGTATSKAGGKWKWAATRIMK